MYKMITYELLSVQEIVHGGKSLARRIASILEPQFRTAKEDLKALPRLLVRAFPAGSDRPARARPRSALERRKERSLRSGALGRRTGLSQPAPHGPDADGTLLVPRQDPTVHAGGAGRRPRSRLALPRRRLPAGRTRDARPRAEASLAGSANLVAYTSETSKKRGYVGAHGGAPLRAGGAGGGVSRRQAHGRAPLQPQDGPIPVDVRPSCFGCGSPRRMKSTSELGI